MDSLHNFVAEHSRSRSFRVSNKKFSTPTRDYAFKVYQFEESAYKQLDLPTRARGLFTYKETESGKEKVVIRGYDKFYNCTASPLKINRSVWICFRKDSYSNLGVLQDEH